MRLYRFVTSSSSLYFLSEMKLCEKIVYDSLKSKFDIESYVTFVYLDELCRELSMEFSYMCMFALAVILPAWLVVQVMHDLDIYGL